MSEVSKLLIQGSEALRIVIESVQADELPCGQSLSKVGARTQGIL